MQPIICDHGNRNMLCPNVVGQSGTASADPVLVTSPPTKMSSTVTPAVSTASRCGHGLAVIASGDGAAIPMLLLSGCARPLPYRDCDSAAASLLPPPASYIRTAR